jgi:hypothetical protein
MQMVASSPQCRQSVFPSSEAFVYAYVLEGTVRSKFDDTP